MRGAISFPVCLYTLESCHGRGQVVLSFFYFHWTAMIVRSALCFTTIRKRTNSFSVKQCRLQTTKGQFLCFEAGWFVFLFFFLIKNFITAFQLKNLDLFLFIIFFPPSPTNYLYFLIARLLTCCRKLMLPSSIIQHVSPWKQGGQRTTSNVLILLGAGRVRTLTF